MEARFFRIHIEEIAYYTKRPKGLFAAVGNLVDQKIMSEAEIEEYWRNRRWFEANLLIPPFYGDLKPVLPITWYKNNAAGNEMFAKMAFYVRMAAKYDRRLYLTYTDTEPGEIVYEDDFQIGVVNSRHGGPGFTTVPYSDATGSEGNFFLASE
ncbi:hypothetical protein HQ520_18155 [bacterium]|nr:hypothetical protein [bacterium]